MKRILCLSGGGVRGVAQLQVLIQREKDLGPLHEAYDLITGSSVGAINASLISTGKFTMVELDGIYDDMIKRVFKPRGFFKKPKYDRNNFYNVWDELVGAEFKYGDSKTDIMTTTVDYVTDNNIFYKSWHSEDAFLPMVDLTMRSFAAPLYFGQIVDYMKKMVYGDGGIGYANFPLDEAKLHAEVNKWYSDGEEVQIDAIGTLFNGEPNDFEKVSKARWGKQLLSYMNPMEGGLAKAQSREDQIRKLEYACKRIPSIKFRYWDAPGDKKKLTLDGVDYMGYYRKAGQAMAKAPLLSIN